MNQLNKAIKIIFMGTGTFAVPVLDLLNKNFNVISCFTKVDKPAGRGKKIKACEIKLKAEDFNLPICQPLSYKNNTDWVNQLKELEPDLIVVTEYNLILPKKILDIPKYGALNIHPSLLPKWRGPSPIEYTLLNNDQETGVCIMKMDEQMDHGPVLGCKKIKIEKNDNAINLYEKLAFIGANLLIKVIPDFIENKIELIEQDHDKATFSKFITKEDGKIDWNKPAQEILNQIKAFICWPGSFTFLNLKGQKKLIKIVDAVVINQNDHKIGQILLTQNKELAIQCGQQALKINQLQLEGKKIMTSKEFLNGYPSSLDRILK